MRILVDQSFPKSIQESRLLDLGLFRWIAEGVSDEELIRAAISDDFQAVLFLGRAPLASEALWGVAREGGIALVATAQGDDPLEAAKAVANNLQALERRVVPGARLVVLAREVRAFEDQDRP